MSSRNLIEIGPGVGAWDTPLSELAGLRMVIRNTRGEVIAEAQLEYNFIRDGEDVYYWYAPTVVPIDKETNGD